MSAASEHARVLLGKATNDLIAAHAILSTGQALDTVCFHTQQAVEKALIAVSTEDKQTDEFKIYPNPAKDEIQIERQTTEAIKISFKLFCMQ